MTENKPPLPSPNSQSQQGKPKLPIPPSRTESNLEDVSLDGEQPQQESDGASESFGDFVIDEKILRQAKASINDPLKDFNKEEAVFGIDKTIENAENRAVVAEQKKQERLREEKIALTPIQEIEEDIKLAKTLKSDAEKSLTPMLETLSATETALKEAQSSINENSSQEEIDYFNSLVEEYKATFDVTKEIELGYRNAVKAEEVALTDKYIKRAQTGDWTGAIVREFVGGTASVLEGGVRLLITAAAGISPTIETGAQLETFEKEFTSKITPAIETIAAFNSALTRNSLLQKGMLDTTPEFVARKQEDLIGGAVLGVARTVPAMLTGAAGLVAQGVDMGYKSIEASDTENELSYSDKLAYGVSFGIVQGILERFGLQTIMNKGIASKLLNQAYDSIITSGEKVTANKLSATLTEIIKPLARGGAGEFVTGASQETAAVGMENFVNIIKDKEIFDTQSFDEAARRILKAGAQEMIGGMIMSTPAAIGAGIQQATKTEYETAEKVIEGNGMIDIIDYVNAKKESGELSEEQATAIISDTKTFAEINTKIPKEMPVENKMKAFELLQEKAALEAEIEGKDPALVQNKIDRIKGKKGKEGEVKAGINQELEELSTKKIADETVKNTEKTPTEQETPVQEKAVVEETLAEQQAPKETVTLKEGIAAKYPKMKPKGKLEGFNITKGDEVIGGVTVDKTDNNWIVKSVNITLNENLNKGHAKEAYRQLQEQAKKVGATLVSDDLQTTDSAKRVWDGFVKRGEARKLDDGTYEMIPELKFNKNELEETTFDYNGGQYTLIPDEKGFYGMMKEDDATVVAFDAKGAKSKEYTRLFNEVVKPQLTPSSKPTDKTKQSNTERKPDKTVKKVKVKPDVKQESAKKKQQVYKTIDDVAAKLKERLKIDLPEGTKKLGIDENDLIDLAAKAAKALVSATVDINQAVKKVVKELRDMGVFENVDEIDFALKVQEKATKQKAPEGKKERKFVASAKKYAKTKGQTIREELDDYYTPQVQAEIKGRTQEMSDEELMSKMEDVNLMTLVDGQDNISIAAAVELFQRKIERGEETSGLFKYLKKNGTTLGQLVSQFAMLNRSTAEGVSMMVRTAVMEAGRELTTEVTKKKVDTTPKEKKSAKEFGKTVANKIRRAKFVKSYSDMSKLQSSAIAPVIAVWDGSMEVFATIAETSGDLTQGVIDAVKYLKGTEWYKGLSDGSRKIAEGRLRNDIEEEILKISPEGKQVLKIREQLQPDSPQSQKLDEISKNLFEAIRDYREIVEKILNNENIKEDVVKKSAKEIEKHARKLELFVDSVLPKKWGDLLTTAVQGSLLTPISIVKNPVYNLARMLYYVPVNMIGEASRLGANAVKYVFKKEVKEGDKIPVFSLAASAYATKMMLTKGVPMAVKSTLTGQTVDGTNYEYQMNRSMMPVRAFMAMLSDTKFANAVGIPKNMLSRKPDGTISLNDRAKKGFEATFGGMANLMLRMLPLGDVPFSAFATNRKLYLIAKSRNLKGKALENFLKYPPKEDLEFAREEGAMATFQEEGTLAKQSQKIISGIANSMEGTQLDAFVKFAVRTQFPYVKTPVNVVSQMMHFAVPALPLARAIASFAKGDVRAGSTYMGMFATGTMMTATAIYLVSNGLITGALYGGGDEGVEKKERNLSYATQPPNTINISGLKRLIEGDDPTYRDGDTVSDYRAFGFLASVLGIYANSESDVRRSIAKKDRMTIIGALDETNSLGLVEKFGNAPAAMKEALNQSFLSGTNTLLNALTGSEYETDRWMTQTFGAVSAVALPNTLTYLNKANTEYLPDLRDDDLTQQLKNVILNKTFQDDALPKRVDLEGNKIQNTPDGENSYVWHLLDFTKTKEAKSSYEMQTIKDVYLETQNPAAIPEMSFVPRNGLKEDGVNYVLTQEEKDGYIGEMQKLKFAELRKQMDKSSWHDKTAYQKAEIMDKAYNTATNSSDAKKIKKKYIEMAKGRR